MAVKPEDLVLAGDFPAATQAEWQQRAATVLRRSGVDSIQTTTYDGIVLDPLYPPGEDAGAPGQAPFVRGGGTEPWLLLQSYDDPDPAEANRQIHTDLDGGVSALWLRLGPGALPVEGLRTALDGVFLDMAPVVLDAGAEYAAAAAELLALTDRVGNLGADPIGHAAATGTALPVEPAARLAADHPGLRTFAVDALPYHDAGGSDAQELGTALATALAYLRAMTEAGMPAATAAGALDFRVAVTADQFGGIAKLRALRRLWSRIGEVVAAPWPARIHAVTSSAMLTRRDPWTNILRGTIACFAASAGGADAVTVQPYDAAIGRSDAGARRIARNTAALLRDEAHIANVTDPGGGSGYVEARTELLAQAAWTWFQEIERAGGAAAALESGLIADRIAEVREQRIKAIATRTDPITGVSEFPHLAETAVSRPSKELRTGGLPRFRYAEPFESLRDRAEAMQPRPTVFLATLGSVAAHSAATGFAANLWNAGGVVTIDPGVPDDVVAAFRESGAKIACICPPANTSTEDIDRLAADLRSAGATRIYLFGEKSTVDNADGFVGPGCDAVAVLTETLGAS